MIRICKFFVFMALLLVLLNVAHAASFEVKVAPVKDRIVVDEVAEFEITITNNLDRGEEFTIKKAGYPFWDVYTKPLQNPITLEVPAQSNSSMRLFVDPLYITSVDTYTLDIGIVQGTTGQEQKVPVTIGIMSTEPLIGGYIPTVLATTGISPEKIDPREQFTIKAVLNNQNPIDYSNLTIKFDSSLFKEEVNTALGPREDKTIEISKKLDDATPPQKDRLVVAVFKDERMIVSPIIHEFEIKEYEIRETLPKEHSFLKIRRGIRVMSNNPDYHGKIKIEVKPIRNLFLTTHPRAVIERDENKQYLTWDVRLDKDKVMVVYTTENYRLIVIIFSAMVAAVGLYFIFRSPIVVKKGIANVGMHEGGISEAKVVVRVKNRSAKQLTDIEVMDNVPHIAHVEKEFSIGSMQPHAILQHPKRGIAIKWVLETLEPGDERVLSYKMRSRLPVLGEFSLPTATARAKVGNRIVISNSNRISIGG